MADDVGAPEIKGAEKARMSLRSAGYCVVCDRIIERVEGGACPKGHPAEAISGKILLRSDEPLPALPRFSWAAFALPPVWGPAHGQWVGVLFLPIWLFADSAVESAARGRWAVTGAVIVALGTVAFQAYFAKRANGVAWRRVSDRMSVDEFARRERVWALACVPVGLLLLGWGLLYRFVL